MKSEVQMEESIRRLNIEYGFELSEDEIRKIAIMAEELNRSLECLHEIDFGGVMPLPKVDRRMKV